MTLDATAATSDVSSHYIEGFLSDGEPIRIPLISEIEPFLWMGGCRDQVRLPDDFAFVLSLYPWERYQKAEHTRRIEMRLYDSNELPDIDLLDRAVDLVVDHVRGARKTLAHCQAGLNRSGLVTALALRKLKGITGAEAIAMLRAKRDPFVLCNPTFAAHVESLD